MAIGKAPLCIGQYNFDLEEVMYYLYLPVVIGESDIRLPQNLDPCRPIVAKAIRWVWQQRRELGYQYVYLSARKGWASPDNPLNRPGWHCDGYGTDDLNYVWWSGPGTRFAVHDFGEISKSHSEALRQFEERVDLSKVVDDLPGKNLYELTPEVVHATPLVKAPGCMRQFVKISFSNHRYNLENNSHNYLFDYAWKMENRDTERNNTHAAQQDYVAGTL